jgi:hypothetical protein
MVYTPVTVTTTGDSNTSANTSTNPWANSEFYFSNGTLSATNNPFGGTNVPWVMDPETRRETYRGYSDKAAYDKAYADAVINFSAAGANNKIGGSSNQTSKSIKQFNMQQVEGLATSAFQAAIGRAATNEELATFLKHLNTEEKKNPTITKTTINSSKNSSSSTSISSGGIDESQFATTESQMHPEFANYQKATTYFDAMTSALRGPTGGGF